MHSSRRAGCSLRMRTMVVPSVAAGTPPWHSRLATAAGEGFRLSRPTLPAINAVYSRWVRLQTPLVGPAPERQAR
ncbi:hypothetical protein F2981_16680 [Sinorhizobium meliloti]|nr:hypothetical protein [Sinorhizobium meliloti]